MGLRASQIYKKNRVDFTLPYFLIVLTKLVIY